MAIHFALFQNHLTSDPNDYAAQVRTTESVGPNELVARMIERGSTVNEATIHAVLAEAEQACGSFVLEGRRVRLGGLCELFPRVIGHFDGITDHFDPVRHRVDVGANPGSSIRNVVREHAHPIKEESVKPAPAPLAYADLASGETNGKLTPGNIGTLSGHRLKFDPAKDDEGIFLIPMKGDGKVVRVSLMQKNKPSELVFPVPVELGKGDCQLEVRTRMANSADLRVGRLDFTLTV